MCWQWEGLVLRYRGSFGIQQEVVEKFYFLSDSGDLVTMFVQDVFAHKLRGLDNRDEDCYYSNWTL